MTDKQTEVSDLLKPRYKVIADYPLAAFSVGKIIEGEEALILYGTDGNKEDYWKLGDYPHLFKRLEWWEERTDEELSELKFVKTHAGNSVRKFVSLDVRTEKIVLDGGKVRNINHWIPAAPEEYESFINQNKQP